MKTTLKATAIVAAVSAIAVGTPVQADENSRIDKECNQLGKIAMNAAYGRVEFGRSYTEAMERSEAQAERYGWTNEAVNGLDEAIVRVYDANPQKLRNDPELMGYFVVNTCKKKDGVVSYMDFLEQLD